LPPLGHPAGQVDGHPGAHNPDSLAPSGVLEEGVGLEVFQAGGHGPAPRAAPGSARRRLPRSSLPA